MDRFYVKQLTKSTVNQMRIVFSSYLKEKMRMAVYGVWNVTDCAMSTLCTVSTAKYFGTGDDIASIDQDE